MAGRENNNAKVCFDLNADYTYSLLVTGITGSGKSSLCNFFCCSKTAFLANYGFASVTSKAGSAIAGIKGKKVKFIDTPGFCDDYETEEEHMLEVGEAIYLARKGVNAICLCINAETRYTKGESATIMELLELKELWPFTFIAFTNAAALGDSEEEQNQQLRVNLEEQRCPKPLLDLLQRVNNRYLLIESVNTTGDTEAYYNLKSAELLTLIDTTYERNSRRLYTNELFIKVGETVERIEQEQTKQIFTNQTKPETGTVNISSDHDSQTTITSKAYQEAESGFKNDLMLKHSQGQSGAEDSIGAVAHKVALQTLQKELADLRLQVKELSAKKNKYWFSTLSKKVTGKGCCIQ